MWLPSGLSKALALLLVASSSFHIDTAHALSENHGSNSIKRLQARGGKQITQNALSEPLGGKLDTSSPIYIKWKPDTKGTITLKLLKGKAPEGMAEIYTITTHHKNTGKFLWITAGSWLEDSGTMEKGHRYGLKIIDDDTENYNFSPPFDLSVPNSQFKKEKENKPVDDDKLVVDTDGGDDDDDEPVDDDKLVVTDGGDDDDDEDNEEDGYGYDDDDDEGYGYDDDDDDDDDERTTTSTNYQTKGSTHSETEDDDEPDFIEPENSVQKGQNHYHKHQGNGKPKVGSTSSIDNSDDEEDFDESNVHKPHPSGAKLNNDVGVSGNNESGQTKDNKDVVETVKGLPKGAKIGIAVGVVVFIAAIILGIAVWRYRSHQKSQREKKKSLIGYDGVGGFIAGGRKSQLYDAPPEMTQYGSASRTSVDTRYDPPTGQGLPVVGSTPRQSIDTRYDPPSQAHYQPGHH